MSNFGRLSSPHTAPRLAPHTNLRPLRLGHTQQQTSGRPSTSGPIILDRVFRSHRPIPLVINQ